MPSAVLVTIAIRGVDDVPPYDDAGRPNLVEGFERMLVDVVERDGDDFVGVLSSTPLATHTALEPGSRLRFAARDVIDIHTRSVDDMQREHEAMDELGFPLQPLEAALQPVDPERLPAVGERTQAVLDRAGARPEEPLPFGTVLAGGDLADPDSWPIYGGRFAPRPDHPQHTGWAIW